MWLQWPNLTIGLLSIPRERCFTTKIELSLISLLSEWRLTLYMNFSTNKMPSNKIIWTIKIIWRADTGIPSKLSWEKIFVQSWHTLRTRLKTVAPSFRGHWIKAFMLFSLGISTPSATTWIPIKTILISRTRQPLKACLTLTVSMSCTWFKTLSLRSSCANSSHSSAKRSKMTSSSAQSAN